VPADQVSVRGLLVSLPLLVACAATPPPRGPEHLGRVDRAQIEAEPKWADARANAHAEPEAARALLQVPPGATVRVFFGAWCGDSRREVSRFFDALDVAGAPMPFAIEYISVDRSKTAPDGLTDGAGLRYVPTFVVLRDGKEVGRIVESSPNGVERDLGALLRGDAAGVISGRKDL